MKALSEGPSERRLRNLDSEDVPDFRVWGLWLRGLGFKGFGFKGYMV